MSTKRPAVLVTGASGFIGLHVVRHLCGTHQVTALDLRPPLKPHPVGVEQIICGLRDGQVPAARFDAIIHLAALGGVRVSIEQPLDCEASNLAATVRLLEHARQHGTPRFIFASSSSVYGPTDGAPSSEDDPLSPCSPYALTKQQGEQWGRLYAQLHGLDFIALRLFAVWGDGQRPDLALESFRRKILAGETIIIHGDGSQRRDLTHVTDVARAVEATLGWNGTGFEVFNIGTGTNHSVNDMLCAVKQWTGLTTAVRYGPEHPADVPATLANIRKAREQLGWQPLVHFPNAGPTTNSNGLK